MRAVVDTSVSISAAINPSGHPARVLAALTAGQFTLVTSAPMLEELVMKLARPRIRRYTRFTPEEEGLFVAAIRAVAEVVEITGDVRLCRDPNDDMVIETALKGRADVLVSRDEDLTRAPELAAALAQAGVRVLTVARFLAELEEGE